MGKALATGGRFVLTSYLASRVSRTSYGSHLDIADTYRGGDLDGFKLPRRRDLEHQSRLSPAHVKWTYHARFTDLTSDGPRDVGFSEVGRARALVWVARAKAISPKLYPNAHRPSPRRESGHTKTKKNASIPSDTYSHFGSQPQVAVVPWWHSQLGREKPDSWVCFLFYRGIMSTLSQIEGNRRNAAKSTGPRSVEGKASSRMNALQTGIHAESTIIIGEDSDDLTQLAQAFYQDHQPETAMECALLDNIIRDTWLRVGSWREACWTPAGAPWRPQRAN